MEIRWSCDPSLIKDETPAEEMLKFPGGLLDFLKSEIGKANTVNSRDFAGRTENNKDDGTRHGGMGGGLDADDRSLCPLLLQHHSHAPGRHP